MDFSYLLDSGSFDSVQQSHADFNVRAESFSLIEAYATSEASTDNIANKENGTQLDIIEFLKNPDSTIRLTAILAVQASQQFHFGNYFCGYEILVLEGDLLLATGTQLHRAGGGFYLRIPYGEPAQFSSSDGCKLLIKLGQMSVTDHELRIIKTDDQDLWLPGPTAGTEVLPLHLHDTKNSLLIRWNTPAYFKPQLDPLGEEIYVVGGMLHDAFGSYEQGSWIRNPIPSWQSWGGHADTVVYYKNGHFPIT